MQLQREKSFVIASGKQMQGCYGKGNEDMVATHWRMKQGIMITVVCCGGQRDGNGALKLG